VVEQLGNHTQLNKGRLFNAAVRHIVDTQRATAAATNETVDCIVLHDVDLIPRRHSRLMGKVGDYRCRHMPWHLSRAEIGELDARERVHDHFYIGGALSLRVGHFTDPNGFSNNYTNSDAAFVSFYSFYIQKLKVLRFVIRVNSSDQHKKSAEKQFN
jgi:hypothetical protein